VGKGINLKKRLESYFSLNLAPKTKNMVSEATGISFIRVTSELEALLLEAKLIKLMQPKYNFIAKDDKHALYIKISDDTFPRVITARKEGSFGPFPSSYKVYSVLQTLRRIFPYADHKLGKKACIYNSIQEHSAVYCGDELNADMSSSFGGIPRSLERGGCHNQIGQGFQK